MAVKQTIKTNASYYLTMTVVGWVDVFTRQNHRDAIIDSLKYCIKHKGLNVYAYCLMSSHLHLIANTDEPYILSDTVRDFKKFTAKRILKQIQEEPESRREWMMNLFKYAGHQSKGNTPYKFWQTGSHPIEVFSPEFTWVKVNYIHNNPVDEGLVKSPEEWRYYSAGNYVNEEDTVLSEVICIGRVLNRIK